MHDVPAVAVVDPDMMASMPKSLAAATGMDALTHAIEGYITKGAWELTDALHLKAIEIIGRSLRGAVEKNPDDIEGMALGQYVAGMCFSNVGLGVDVMSQEEYRNAAIQAVQQLSIDVGIPPKLHQIGVKEEDLPALSIDAFNDVCTGKNPRDCTPESILEVYKTAF